MEMLDKTADLHLKGDRLGRKLAHNAALYRVQQRSWLGFRVFAAEARLPSPPYIPENSPQVPSPGK